MQAIEIARRMAELGQEKDACQAYNLALGQGPEPEEKMEAALYILQSGGDYKVAYTCFLELYNQGHFQEDCLSIMTQAFYQPNIKLQKNRYERNCKLLSKYPYLFRKDFVDFEALPVRFYPFDDNGYIPFRSEEQRFEDYVNPKDTIISRYFFKDLEKPILAQDVFSQYELEYLRDNVRRSEDVAMENHVYLAYSSWGEFCSYLQILDVRPLLKDKKLVFLIGDEIEQYPIDFKERFGIDYSTCTPQPVGIWELNRLIWHTQLASHNGGDFFNEIFDNHPNLMAMPSIMLSDVEKNIEKSRKLFQEAKSLEEARAKFPGLARDVLEGLYREGTFTTKELLLALYFYRVGYTDNTQWNARIVPALFFQPHFYNLEYKLQADSNGQVMLTSKQYEELKNSSIFQSFKYIKTFTPMRRITNSYGATIKFMLREDMQKELLQQEKNEDGEEIKDLRVVPDEATVRVLNRSFMIDPYDRLYRDSVLVRFEDGKLNPKATFTALAAFLDLPYTESMTYCSLKGERDPESLAGNDLGFSTAAIYRTYDDFATDDERCYIEYLLRDAYQFYGYDFHYYDGGPMDSDKINELLQGFTILDRLMRESEQKVVDEIKVEQNGEPVDEEITRQVREKVLDNFMQGVQKNRMRIAKLLMGNLRFVNHRGQPLHMMPKLKLDPALLEQPLYH